MNQFDPLMLTDRDDDPAHRVIVDDDMLDVRLVTDDDPLDWRSLCDDTLPPMSEAAERWLWIRLALTVAAKREALGAP